MPIIIIRLYSTKFAQKYTIHPETPWDRVFGLRIPYWIIVHLKDGRKIGGRYDVKSFVSTNDEDLQLYIEEAWKIDNEGRFIEKVNRTKGMIILGEEIVIVELFSME